VRYASGLDDGLAATAAALQLDAVCFAMRLPKPRPACALIGYVPDYQHRHMPQLFPAKELTERDKMFGQLITSSNAMVMSSQAEADDMRRFTPEPVPRLHVIPFSPTLNPEWLQDRPERVKAYAIDGPYFIVCNQFWMHKDHLTVFRALAEITRPWPNVSLVCTGDTTDYRDPTYFAKLEAEATKLALGSRLRFLGHIPKRDQIELLKHAVALIQPTLFEGGPGGGATCEAVALGQRVLITDLPVNQEIDSGDIRFFAPGDHRGLAKLMGNVLDEVPTRRNDPALLARTNARMHRAGESIWSAIRSAIDEHRNYLLKRPYEKE
jgi:glycosyltransferase involved in cell wall biosynthesis